MSIFLSFVFRDGLNVVIGWVNISLRFSYIFFFVNNVFLDGCFLVLRSRGVLLAGGFFLYRFLFVAKDVFFRLIRFYVSFGVWYGVGFRKRVG